METCNITSQTCEYIIEQIIQMKKYMNTFVCYLIHNKTAELNLIETLIIKHKQNKINKL